jgi:hypothetical protein
MKRTDAPTDERDLLASTSRQVTTTGRLDDAHPEEVMTADR